jgi:hypothetical protein
MKALRSFETSGSLNLLYNIQEEQNLQLVLSFLSCKATRNDKYRDCVIVLCGFKGTYSYTSRVLLKSVDIETSSEYREFSC